MIRKFVSGLLTVMLVLQPMATALAQRQDVGGSYTPPPRPQGYVEDWPDGYYYFYELFIPADSFNEDIVLYGAFMKEGPLIIGGFKSKGLRGVQIISPNAPTRCFQAVLNKNHARPTNVFLPIQDHVKYLTDNYENISFDFSLARTRTFPLVENNIPAWVVEAHAGIRAVSDCAAWNNFISVLDDVTNEGNTLIIEIRASAKRRISQLQTDTRKTQGARNLLWELAEADEMIEMYQQRFLDFTQSLESQANERKITLAEGIKKATQFRNILRDLIRFFSTRNLSETEAKRQFEKIEGTAAAAGVLAIVAASVVWGALSSSARAVFGIGEASVAARTVQAESVGGATGAIVVSEVAIDEVGSSTAAHIFRNKAGHLAADTPANRALLIGVASKPKNYVRTDRFGKKIYGEILDDGRQVWAYVRGNKIVNGGINETPRIPHPETGFSSPTRPPQTRPRP